MKPLAINTSWRFWVFCFSTAITLYLSVNRLSLVEAVKNNFLLRNPLEHFFWGFMLPIICVVLILGVGHFLRLPLSWKLGYGISIFVFIAVGCAYYLTGVGVFQPIDIIIDIVGFGLGSWFVISERNR